MGGAEHAVSHILYSRLIHKFLFDIGKVPTREPYRKLLNQGMIGGPISYIHLGILLTDDGQRHPIWVSSDVAEGTPLEVEGAGKGYLVLDESTGTRLTPLRFVTETSVNNESSYRLYHASVDEAQRLDHQDAAYFRTILQQGNAFAWHTDKEGRQYLELSVEQGKMSKRKYNAVNPDDICERYGADCFRMYEMFLGPIDQAKPWSVSGIDGVYRFLRRFWNLFVGNGDRLNVSDEAGTREEMKVLHTLIRKVTEDVEKLSFNTCVSAFMVATNELTKLNCNKREVLEPAVRLIAPFAPHLAEELFEALGGEGSVHHATWPQWEENYLVEDSITYPVAFNGKTRLTVDVPADASKADIESAARDAAAVQAYLEGKTVRKVIVVPKRMINFVVA